MSIMGCALGFAPPAFGSGLPASLVQTEYGPVVGTVTNSTSTFLGIPYAAPPVGNLRWMPPQPHEPWMTPLDATQFGSECPQGGSTDEDCLFLNVYVPTFALQPGAKRVPVMVWVHGGAFTSGAGSDYDPTRLVTQGGVIVVTINYRLGALGFLAHSALSAESPVGASGNYGIMDQQFAMQWVKENIVSFGGDPGNVTIFGESAGGLSMFSNLVSPRAASLFRRVIIESGSYQLILPTLASASANGASFANAIGCADQTAACLRSMPVATILSNQNAIAGLDGLTLTPNIDGYVLPQSIDTALASGDFNRVPVIDGTNHDEFRLFVALIFDLGIGPMTPSEYPLVLNLYFGADTPSVLAQYPLSDYPSPDLAFATLITDNVFSCPALDADAAMAKYATTRAYEFADENAPAPLPPVSFPYGASHGFELEYLFNPLDSMVPFTTAQQMLSNVMILEWTNFAKSGNPGEDWPMLSKSGDGTIKLFRPSISSREKLSAFSADHQCSFWQLLSGD